MIKKFCARSARSPSNRRFRKFCAWRNSVPTLYDIGNGKPPSGELYGASLHGVRAELAQNKSIGKGKGSKSCNYFSD